MYANTFSVTGTTISGGLPAATFTNVLGNATRSGVQTGGTDPVPTTFTNNQLVEWVSGGPYVVVGTSPTNSYAYTTAPIAYSAPFNNTFSSNSSIVTWTFNMEVSAGASGFANTQDNAVVVLGGTNANVRTAGNGYAVAFNPGTPRAIELIRYTGGLQGTVTTIISSSVLLANATNYASVRVTYDPTTNTWNLYVRDDGAGAFADPYTGVTTSGGSAVDATYTGTAMSVFGFFSNHTATSVSLLIYLDADSYSYFDNYTVSMNCSLPAIAGAGNVCQGATITLSDATTGGTWTSGSTGIATIGSSSGVVTGGATTGTSSITYSSGGCTATTAVTVIATPSAISGTTVVCQGSAITLSDATGAGTWSSSNTAVGTVGLTTGVVSALLAGTTNITFTLNSTGCTAAAVVTVNPLPTAILGTPAVCVGSPIVLSDATAGGTWAISNSNATIVAAGSNVTVTGATAGTALLTYTMGTGCSITAIVTVNPTPTAIIGTTNICQGLSSTLTDALTGGTWLSGNTTVATIGSSSGSLFGAGAGSTTVTYTMPTGCSVTAGVTVNAAPGTINGTLTVCEGLNTALTNTLAGGVWTASNANASVGSSSGIVTGVTAGTVTISYTTPTCNPVLAIVTVNPSPALIPGTLTICSGAATTLTDAVTGGTWLSSNTAVATIGSSSGFLSGLLAGTTLITYTLPAGCNTISTFTVNPSPSAIGGAPAVCQGLTTTLTDLAGSGTWSSSNANASIGSTSGLLLGNTAGTSIITYTLPAGCTATELFTVNPLPANITGLASGCAGLVINLSDATTGGTWSSSNSGIAPVGSATGVVTASSTGNAIITYTLPTGCIATIVVTVNTSPLAIVGTNPVCQGSFTPLTDPAIGGTWSSGNTVTATIGSTSGILSALASGTTAVTYTLPIGGCTSVTVFTVNPVPGSINGPGTVCAGGFSITLTDASSGGTWASGNTGVATIGSTSGILTSALAGTAVITYAFISTGCGSTTVVTVDPLPATITGAGIVCIGLSTTLNDIATPGTWSSLAPGTASVGSASGVVTGVAAGNTIISYTLPTGCYAVCIGSAIVLTDGTGGGTWSLTNYTGAASIGSTGIVTGIAAGLVAVSYVTTACNAAVYPVTVNSLPAPITGIGSVCSGSTISLSDITVGGSWSSSNSAVTVSSTGVVGGLSAGSGSTISYALPTGCFVTAPVIVDAVPLPIQGIDSVCPGDTVFLTDPTALGVWSSSDGTIALSYATSGMVIGVVHGNVTISYTLISGCYATMPFKVTTPLPASLSIAQSPDTLVCSDSTVTLTANVTNGGTPSFVWERFGSYIGTGAVYPYNPTHGDFITCVMTTHDICASPGIISKDVTLNVYPIVSPVVHISSLTADSSSYMGEEYTFFTDVTFGGVTPTYQWYVNSDSITGATNNTYTTRVYGNNDTVSCVVHGNSPCDTTTYVGISNTIVVVGQGYLSAGNLSAGNNDFTLFPNPNTGSFTLSGKLGLASNKEVTLEITDMLGRTVYTGTITPVNGNIRTDIKLNDGIAQGSYLLSINTDTGKQTFHFAISK